MRRLNLRSTFHGWANSPGVPGISRDVVCGWFRSLPRSGCTPEPRVSRVSRRHPGCTMCPARNGRVQDNDTHRRSTSPQQPAVCLRPRGTPRISVSERAGVAHGLRLDRSAMHDTLTQVAPPTAAMQRCSASTLGCGVQPLRGKDVDRLREVGHMQNRNEQHHQVKHACRFTSPC